MGDKRLTDTTDDLESQYPLYEYDLTSAGRAVENEIPILGLTTMGLLCGG